MLKVARLIVSFDRGVKRNAPQDIGLNAEPSESGDGKLIRGLGTHFLSAEDRDRAKACEAEDARLRKAFNYNFTRSPIPGMFLVESKASARAFLAGLTPSALVKADVRVYDFSPDGGDFETADVRDWIDRIRTQLTGVEMGRAKEGVDEKFANGLDIVERLAACPFLSDATRRTILATIADARLAKVNRVEFKRRIATMALDLNVKPVVAPRRVRGASKVSEPAGAA
jgi:hypothetical protein